ncbi:hypothetical protein LTR27_004290 [Elasticomyces elasticus]|nr:hypothetical protein LTR27_004290 [Elasticomyces elasticus]
MAFWEGSFQAMDPLTLSTIIQLQLEDSEELSANVKGKQREGTISDAQLALQMYTKDLMSTDAVLSDRRMAQSIATAVIRDGHVIQRAHQREDQIVRDHEIARQLHADDEAPLDVDPVTKHPLPEQQDPWKDSELLAKVAAIYMREPGSTGSTPPALVYDSDSDSTIAESSAWAAARKGDGKPRMGHCVACGEDVEFYQVARVPCDHEYCRPCLEQLFELSMTDETLFPPRCDGKEIPLARVSFFLPPELVKRFEARYVELSTKDRVYCHYVRCNSFIPATAVNPATDIATCLDYERTTCAICKGPSHTGDCPNDTALQQLVNTANNEQWQRCLDCKRFVELEQGCNHMTCPCGAHFCYVCGQRWKSCACPQWDEPRLLNRAAQIVDRNPGRRLFEPQHVLHPQPASRRASMAAADALRRPNVASPASSVWQSDFEDRSEWEHDWSGDETSSDEDGDPTIPPAVSTTPSGTGMSRLRAGPSATVMREARESRQRREAGPSALTLRRARESREQREAGELREQAIAKAVEHLRENHECEHEKWQWIRGPHQCEECSFMLPQYIFECKQCHLQACSRCRRNRL